MNLPLVVFYSNVTWVKLSFVSRRLLMKVSGNCSEAGLSIWTHDLPKRNICIQTPFMLFKLFLFNSHHWKKMTKLLLKFKSNNDPTLFSEIGGFRIENNPHHNVWTRALSPLHWCVHSVCMFWTNSTISLLMREPNMSGPHTRTSMHAHTHTHMLTQTRTRAHARAF